MKVTHRIALITALVLTAASAQAVDITGAGATFPYPIYAKWAEAYKAKTGSSVNYQSIGSGGGIKQIKARTVDFGASDKPLTQEELTKGGLLQFPVIIGGVVMALNLEGVPAGKLKLSGPLIADLYLGKIKKWNDSALAALNPGIKLPDENITVVRRADSSGTTFLFTDYLSKVSPDWKSKVGSDASVAWPEGVGGKGNEGVASYVQRIKGSIGYVEYAFAKKNKMNVAQLKNRDGNFVEADNSAFQAAAAYADWAKTPGFYEILTNEPGKNSWPITGASFILMHAQQADPAKGKEALKFFDWALKNGGKMAEELDYVPLPADVIKLVEQSWQDKINDGTGKPLWP
ncbi:MAG: phosphate ABC transporter substrate-binding protein PstS [Burkholderiales bacterium]